MATQHLRRDAIRGGIVDKNGSSSSHGWLGKFGFALRGVGLAMRDPDVRVHVYCGIAVVFAGIALRVSRVEWCILVICIAVVVSAEIMNSSIERLAKAVTSEHDTNVGASLDLASGAVMTAAFGAAIVGAITFGHRCGVLAGWWS